MKILTWDTAKNEGAQEALEKVINLLQKAEPKIAFIPIILVIEELKKQYQ